MILLRRLMGGVLRRQRQRQGKTLREVSSAARVSLGYLSEVERGQKEPSSELLASICDALRLPISDVLREVSDDVALAEALEAAPAMPAAVPVPAPMPLEAVPAGHGSDAGPDAALSRSAAAGRGHQVSNVAA